MSGTHYSEHRSGSGPDRRNQFRIMDHFGVLVDSPKGDKLEMAAKDLSPGGLCAEPGRWTVQQLWPEGAPEPGQVLDLVLLLPVGLHGRTYELKARCRVHRLIRQSERRYEVGLEFIDMSASNWEILSDYVAGQGPASAHRH